MRFPDIAGAVNFRDAGGYLTRDGKRLRWGRVFRSGATDAMTPEDMRFIAESKIRCVFDLRSNSERREHPSRLQTVPGIEYLTHDYRRLPGDITRMVKDGLPGREQCRDLMKTAYRLIPYEFREPYRQLFLCLSAGKLPMLFNCSAGKDRTGIAAAIILAALGVSPELITEDYLLTERYFERNCTLTFGRSVGSFMTESTRESWEPLMRAESVYLESMFGEVERRSGTIAGYLTGELRLPSTIIDDLRSQLLEDAT
jgi:protein-tyrosine phosphatase